MIYILGLDGLEYDFVEKWNTLHLKQREYGKIKVPINQETGVPTSPEVWASFLTGKHIQKKFVRNSPPLEPVFKAFKFIRRYTDLRLGLRKKISRSVPKKWWWTHRTGFPPLRHKTFLDLTNSKEINAPYYSYDHAIFNIIRYFAGEKLSMKQAYDMLKAEYEKSKKQIFHEIKKLQNVDVIFAYMHFPDVIQHFLITKPSEIKKYYLDLDNYVRLLKSIIKGSTLFIIISDHGFNLETQTHSTYGFYSSNMTLDPKPKEITDFYKICTRI